MHLSLMLFSMLLMVSESHSWLGQIPTAMQVTESELNVTVINSQFIASSAIQIRLKTYTLLTVSQ